MGAMRKAGVWLGLIEDEDDRHYDGPGYDDDFEDEADEVPAPLHWAAERAFERLAAVASALRDRYPTADLISAGMSADLEQAVAFGATHVRIGSALLGNRPALR